MFTKEQALEELARKGLLKNKPKNNIDTAKTPQTSPSNSWAYENIARPAARAGKSLAKGAASIGDLAYLPINLGANALGYKGFVPPSAAIGQLIDQYAGDLTTPRNNVEKKIDAASEFVSSLAGGGVAAKAAKALLLPGSKISKTLDLLAPQSASEFIPAAAAGYLSEQAAQNNPDNPLAPLLGGLGGALAGSGLTGLGKFAMNPRETTKNLTQNTLSKTFKVNQDKLKNFENAGITPTLGDVSDRRATGMVQNTLKELPFIGQPIEDAMSKAQNQINSFFEKNSMNPRFTQAEAGELAQKGLEIAKKENLKSISRLIDNRKKYITSDATVEPNNLKEALRNKPKFETQIAQKEFEKSKVGQLYNKLQTLVGNNKQIPFKDLEFLRQSIDDEVSTFGALGDKTQGTFKHLSGTIRQDINKFFDSLGPQASGAHKAYNKEYAKFADKQRNIVDKLTKNKTATQTFKDIVNNQKVDGRKAKVVFDGLDSDEQKLFSGSLIRELGSSPENEFMPNVLARKFNQLEPEVQDILLKPYSKDTQKDFRSVLSTIDNIRDVANQGNFSKTAYFLKTGGLAAGLVLAPFKTIPLIAAARGASSKLFTNQDFIKWLAQGQNISANAFAKHIQRLPAIAKNTPALAPDINNYINEMKKVQKDEEQAQQKQPQFSPNNSSFTKEMALAELEARKLPKALQENPNTTTKILDKIAQIESGGNPNAKSSTSSASGLFQITDDTWKSLSKKYNLKGNKNDIDNQRAAAALLLNENKDILTKALNKNPSNGELYIAHFLGPKEAVKLIKAKNDNIPAASLFPKAAKANRNIFFKNKRAISTNELYDKLIKLV